jgi:hypothetical protein
MHPTPCPNHYELPRKAITEVSSHKAGSVEREAILAQARTDRCHGETPIIRSAVLVELILGYAIPTIALT